LVVMAAVSAAGPQDQPLSFADLLERTTPRGCGAAYTYFADKLSPILLELLPELLIHKPDNVKEFSVDFLKSRLTPTAQMASLRAQLQILESRCQSVVEAEKQEDQRPTTAETWEGTRPTTADTGTRPNTSESFRPCSPSWQLSDGNMTLTAWGGDVAEEAAPLGLLADTWDSDGGAAPEVHHIGCSDIGVRWCSASGSSFKTLLGVKVFMSQEASQFVELSSEAFPVRERGWSAPATRDVEHKVAATRPATACSALHRGEQPRFEVVAVTGVDVTSGVAPHYIQVAGLAPGVEYTFRFSASFLVPDGNSDAVAVVDSPVLHVVTKHASWRPLLSAAAEETQWFAWHGRCDVEPLDGSAPFSEPLNLVASYIGQGYLLDVRPPTGFQVFTVHSHTRNTQVVPSDDRTVLAEPHPLGGHAVLNPMCQFRRHEWPYWVVPSGLEDGEVMFEGWASKRPLEDLGTVFGHGAHILDRHTGEEVNDETRFVGRVGVFGTGQRATGLRAQMKAGEKPDTMLARFYELTGIDRRTADTSQARVVAVYKGELDVQSRTMRGTLERYNLQGVVEARGNWFLANPACAQG